MIHFCFLAKIVTFQKVAQNLTSRLKRAIKSRTQQPTYYVAVFFSRRERCHTYSKLILDLPVGIFVPVEYQLHMTVSPNTGMRTVFAEELALHPPCIKQRPMWETAIRRLTN